MTREFAILIAIALGETRAAATARIDAAYPELLPPPAPGPKDVIGRRSELKAGRRTVTELLADGTEREAAGG
jgi:hypothetical protein